MERTPLDAPDAGAFTLRQTNVSNPSVIHSRPSLTSVAASEDYYSYSNSGSSGRSIESQAQAFASRQTITRYAATPPSRYRTPAQSTTQLQLLTHEPVTPVVEDDEERRTPLRGEGQRRSSAERSSAEGRGLLSAEAQPSTTAFCGVSAGSNAVQPPPPTQPPSQLRNGGIRRKPVPSVVMEDSGSSRISPTLAQSSAAQEINRERDAPTPGVDDTPYVRFAIDQLTRDEEVRGSRRYPGTEGFSVLNTQPGTPGAAAALGNTGDITDAGKTAWGIPAVPQQWRRYQEVPQEEDEIQEAIAVPVRSPARPSYEAYSPATAQQQQAQEVQVQRPSLFVPISEEQAAEYQQLTFVPGILRKLALGLFILALLAYLVCLIIAAVWSRSNRGQGLTSYDGFGDGKYFLFRYLPTILGMALLFWLFQIVAAVYRVAPFMAMSSFSAPSSRLKGAKLPLQPRSWLRPYFGHFGARMPAIGTFLLLAWLQIFTIPLLASSFNVHQDPTGVWNWIAVQGVVWVVIALYILLLIATIVLFFKFGRTTTGLKWDPRSLADMIVLLESSNALDNDGDSAPQIGYFRSSVRPNHVFHTYGIVAKPARCYEVHEGRLLEKRYSDPGMDIEAGQPNRHSKEAFIPRDQQSEDDYPTSSPLPWFLRSFFVLLWIITAIVLLLAFLIVSYLPATTVSNGFDPMVGASVDVFGFSGTNFLYSFIPALLATIAFLGWYDIDLAYRRLTPFESLTDIDGDVVESTLLPSYTADLPIIVSLSAAVNGHYRMAFVSMITLLSAAIPILAGGVFWAQFFIIPQQVEISAHMPAYYALTVFVTIYGLAYLAIWPSSSLRNCGLPDKLDTFTGIKDCFRQSRLLDDFAFRHPASKTDLVTRLLSYEVPEPRAQQVYANTSQGRNGNGNSSKVSVVDSIRGYGSARSQAVGLPVPRGSEVLSGGGKARYGFGRIHGRDGRDAAGVARMGR